jgi:hypothetical protein
MNDQPLGLTFKETMAGGFALGQTDPAAGRAAGEQAGNEFAMHANVAIRDLNRFLAEPQHAGELSGTIDFPPFGNGIPSSAGVFNLLSPGEEPRLKLMVYELAFTHDGKPYYMAGRKEVRNDAGFDLWSDTTTLYTRLHGGSDKSGPVVGAGTLTLGVTSFIRALGTVQILNAPSVAAKADALARFGRFFLGELWDSYGVHLARNS